ncbi:hypothetical protein MRX96_019255 [Rhipicephalus microplus]
MCPECLSVTFAKLAWRCGDNEAVITRKTSERCLLGLTHAIFRCVLKAVHLHTLSAHLFQVSVATHPLWYCGFPVNEACQWMHMMIAMGHTLHYSSGVKNVLLLHSASLHELTTIARVRGASRAGCHPINENMLRTIRLLAHSSLLYLVKTAIHHLCEPKVQAEESASGWVQHRFAHTRQYTGGRNAIASTSPRQLLHIQALM